MLSACHKLSLEVMVPSFILMNSYIVKFSFAETSTGREACQKIEALLNFKASNVGIHRLIGSTRISCMHQKLSKVGPTFLN